MCQRPHQLHFRRPREGVARLDDARVEQVAAGVVHPVADAPFQTLARHRNHDAVVDQLRDERDEVGMHVAEPGPLDHEAVEVGLAEHRRVAVDIEPGGELEQVDVGVQCRPHLEVGCAALRVFTAEFDGSGVVVDGSDRVGADGVEGVPPGGVVLPDAGAPVERAGVVGGRVVHTHEHLGRVGRCGLDGRDRVHHVVGGGPIGRALASGEDDRDRRLEHVRQRRRGELHRVSAVHHHHAVGARADLLGDGLGEILPHVGGHVLREDVGDDPPAVVGAAGEVRHRTEHVLGVELRGDGAGPVIHRGGDRPPRRDERDRGEVLIELDSGGVGLRLCGLDVVDVGLERLDVGLGACDPDVVPAVELDHEVVRGRGRHQHALVRDARALDADAVSGIHTRQYPRRGLESTPLLSIRFR